MLAEKVTTALRAEPPLSTVTATPGMACAGFADVVVRELTAQAAAGTIAAIATADTEVELDALLPPAPPPATAPAVAPPPPPFAPDVVVEVELDGLPPVAGKAVELEPGIAEEVGALGLSTACWRTRPAATSTAATATVPGSQGGRIAS
jgi:hypothetical protein